MLFEGRILQALDKADDHDDRLGREIYKNVSRKFQDFKDKHLSGDEKPGMMDNMVKGIKRTAEDARDTISDTIKDHSPGIAAAGLLGAGYAARKYLNRKKSK